MQDGIIMIDKPAGMTSFGVVARIRRVLSRDAGKKVKVGHTGTLDPFATGLMIIVVGKECRNAMTYTKLDKIYDATFRLGQTSSTGDPEGEVTDISSDIPTREQIQDAMKSFTGKIRQRPPIYSAIKINGQRAYQLARDGKPVEIPEREVEVFSFDIIDYSYPLLDVRIHVSSGTYIRSIAEDLGKTVGTGAYCIELRRISIADWIVDDAKKLADYGITD
jgi:tRNA pseudouridine55 synthase